MICNIVVDCIVHEQSCCILCDHKQDNYFRHTLCNENQTVYWNPHIENTRQVSIKQFVKGNHQWNTGFSWCSLNKQVENLFKYVYYLL